jgi:beta-lactamase class A
MQIAVMQMLALMHDNADSTRMISGLPADAYVSHKSGWIEDMQRCWHRDDTQ